MCIFGYISFQLVTSYSLDSYFEYYLNLVPAVVYSNADIQKLEAIKGNRRKSGVYRWVNLINGKSYIGSSSNLGERLYRYYKLDYLLGVLARSRSNIISSLLKYGYSSFRLEILEYCSREDLLKKEQDYIDGLKPEYNILKTTISSLGLKHTEEAKLKMSKLALGREISRETRAKISAAKIGQRGMKVLLVDHKTGDTAEYVSINQAAKALGVRSEKVRRSILAKSLLLGQYRVSLKEASST